MNTCLFIVACERFFGQKQHGNHASATIFTGFGPLQRFAVSKIEEPYERFATIKELKPALLEVLNAVPKSAYEKCFKDWKKLAQVYCM